MQLISGYEEDTLTTQLIANYDWYILPVVNPDGYEYSNTTVMSFNTSLNYQCSSHAGAVVPPYNDSITLINSSDM